MAGEDLKTKKRSSFFDGGTARQTQQELSPRKGSISNIASVQKILFPETQVTVSESHPWPPRRGAAVGDVGGSFSTMRNYVIHNGGYRRIVTSRTTPDWTYQYVFDGKVLPIIAGDYPPTARSSNNRMDQLGATAVARCAPTNSVANASTFLGELMKDGLPHLIGSTVWGSKTGNSLFHKKGGDEYLNLQFALTPMYNDIRDFAKAVTHADAVMKQYERDAGRVVRRRYNFPKQTEREETKINSGFGGMPQDSRFFAPDSVGGTVRVRETTRTQWFSGAFTYHLPSGYDSRKRMDKWALEAKKLLGLSLDPETLWNLAPWSWAADWFSSTGDVIHNLQHMKAGGLVMRYGYMMEHTIVKDTYTCPGVRLIDGSRIPPLSLVTETKQRVPANPFGFGVHWDGLSPYQASIAAALGLSRRG